MELSSLPRNHKGKLWELDKLRRWKSKNWRHWVRGLNPAVVPGAPTFRSCAFDIVIAAHFRYPGCGIATRPADCFVYPMHDADHKDAHGFGQSPQALQWRWVTETMIQGITWGKLEASVEANGWIARLCAEATQDRADLSTPAIEAVAAQWAHYFMTKDLQINEFNGGM